MEERVYYDLAPSQDVAYLQCKYSLFKRVINILTSITFEETIDFDIMLKAYNKMVERHDCLGIKFAKKKGALMQRFGQAEQLQSIPVFTFKTQKEQEEFVDKVREKPIKYLKGKVIEPYFINTFDGKQMVFLKVCHLVLDIYGIGIIFKDLIEIYNALKDNKPMPEPPTKFQDVVRNDLERKNNKEYYEKSKQYFTKLLSENSEPYYAGLHGENNKLWQKRVAKGKHGMPLFLIQNDTKEFCYKISADIVDKAFKYCEENNCSIATLLFYICTVATAKINNNPQNLLPLILYNCRSAPIEKKCGGSKAQSVACYVHFDYQTSFEESFKQFNKHHFTLSRHYGFPDRDFETILHKTYKSSYLEMYYSFALSFMMLDLPENIKFDVYSNQKGALPAYIVQLLNTKTKEIDMYYDVQTKIISQNDVESFHKNYISLIEQIIENPKSKLCDLAI